MPNFPAVIRDELHLTHDFTDKMFPSSAQTHVDLPETPLILVARVIHLAGGTIPGRDVLLIADEVDELGKPDGVPGLRLVTDRAEAVVNTTGRAGHTLTIWTRKLGVASAVSIGQQGGIGLTGRPGTDLDCTPPAVTGSNLRPEPIDPIPPIPDPIPGRKGGTGKDGAKGGPGGRIVVNTVAPPPPNAASAYLGVGGAAGTKGPGGKGGQGCPAIEANRGPTGDKGGTLGAGDNVAATVAVVTEAAFDATIQAEVFPLVWSAGRNRTGDVANRRGQPDFARSELDRAAKLAAPNETAVAVRTRQRYGLTPLGFERDLDVRPALDVAEDTWRDAGAKYKRPMSDDARRAIRFLDRSELQAHRQPMLDALNLLIGEDLPAIEAAVAEGVAKVTKARSELVNKLEEAAGRISTLVVDQEVPPGVTLPTGVTVDAPDLAQRIRDLLADEKGQAPDSRHLVATDLDLLAADGENDAFPGMNPLVDAAGEPFAAPNQALQNLRQRAAGLAGADLTEPNPTQPRSWSNPKTVVSFRAVRDGLRTAGADARLRLALAELVELAQRTRILQLREIQAATGAQLRTDFASRVKTDAFSMQQPTDQLATTVLALDWMNAAQDFADVFSFDAHAAERSVTLYTLDATFHGGRYPESGSPSTASGGTLFSLDVEGDIRQSVAHPGFELADAARFVRETNPGQAELLYGKRGTFIAGRGDSGVDPLVFSSDDRPEVLIRLKTDADVWFDAEVGDLSPGRAEGKVVGVGVVFEGVTTSLDGTSNPPDTLTVFVEHSGISAQRRLDGAVVPQYLYPGQVQVTLRRGPTVNGQLSTDWTGSMRYDDAIEGTDLPGAPQDFPLWGRGAAAGWRMRFADPGIVDLVELERFELEVEYDGFALSGVTSTLRRIDAPLGALLPGQTVHATAVLTAPAPAGGLKISLKSQEPAALSVPAVIMVPAGADRASIPVKVLAPTSGLVRLTATTPDGFRRRALVTVPKPAAGQLPAVTRLDIRAPGEELASVSGLAFDGDRLLATAGEVFIDTDGSIRPEGPGNLLSVKTGPNGLSGLQRFPIVKQPRAVTVANGKAYLVNSDPTVFSLGIVDLATTKPIAETHVGFGPTRVAVDAAANLVYVSNWGGRSVEVFNGSTGQKLDTIPGLRGPHGLAIDPARRRIYVALNYFSNGPADTENGLGVIQRAPDGSHSLLTIVKIPGRTLPIDVAYDTARELIQLVNIGVAGEAAPGVTTYAAADLEQLGFTPVPGPLICCDLHQATGAVACGGPAPGVHVVDGVNRRLVSSQPVAQAVASVAYHQPTGAIFVGDRQKGEIIRLAPVSVDQVAWR